MLTCLFKTIILNSLFIYRVNKSSTFMTSWLSGKNKKSDNNDEDQMRKKPKK